VRHRAGTAFSQTSGRYVRTDSINFVHDPILDCVKDELTEALNYLEAVYKRIEAKVGIADLKDFGKKKKLTSAMRRILPNGQSNEIGFSLNLRALRHTIEMRTSEAAEWEIRLIFNQVANLVKSKYPAIFADAQVTEVNGLNQIKFTNSKI
jgi:thymidylate synthase (FAD)